MKKFIFTPLWNVEKTEKILSDYEKDGYLIVFFILSTAYSLFGYLKVKSI